MSVLEERLTATIHNNLLTKELIRMALVRQEGELTSTGALQVFTGRYTGRSPKDKYIVRDAETEHRVDWGTANQPLSPASFERLYEKAMNYMSDKELFVFEGYAGADEAYRLPIRVINEYAWQNLFARQLFIRPIESEQPRNPEFTVIALPGLRADPSVDGTRTETFICISYTRRVVLIGGTEYAGEIKKSIFSVLNYLLPKQGVFPMHCSANVGENGDVALFFGLSGTGKTTLSADPSRRLIGDDEHGWSDRGVFNFEGGCYAKCANLSKDKEPQIWNAIRFGTVLENVVLDSVTGLPDFDDLSRTENTRAAYSLDMIPGALHPGTAGHPNVIIFLTADAFGVLPPISRLTKEQAMYHFLSGYTSKLAGTERGVTEPEATFSSCFGAPFLPLSPIVYAELLGGKIDAHQTKVYLLNTGWTGGPYGVGKRMELSYTRTMVAAVLDGSIEQSEFAADPMFGLSCPVSLPGVPGQLLQPRNAWPDATAYDRTAKELAERFVNNFKRFEAMGASIADAGPKLQP